MTKHTALPWSHYDDTGSDGKTGRHEIVGPGKTVARIYQTKGMEAEDAANAAFIVRAANAHDKLVEALQEGADCLDDMIAGRGGWAVEEVLRDMREAIRIAKGEQ